VFRGIAGAGEDGEARVFGKVRIGLGELAEEEVRAFSGFDEAGVETAGAETKLRVSARR